MRRRCLGRLPERYVGGFRARICLGLELLEKRNLGNSCPVATISSSQSSFQLFKYVDTNVSLPDEAVWSSQAKEGRIDFILISIACNDIPT